MYQLLGRSNETPRCSLCTVRILQWHTQLCMLFISSK